MAVYWISIVDAKGVSLTGARSLQIEDLDFAWNHFYQIAVQRMGGAGQIRSYDCMKLSRHSKLYKRWEAQQAKQSIRSYSGKYRQH